jgi:hypothetical protein
MNNVNIPGFTAETALYVVGEHYQLVSANSNAYRAGQVLPQMRILVNYACNWSYCCAVTLEGQYGVPYLTCAANRNVA